MTTNNNTVFRCQECDQEFHDLGDLKEHRLTHSCCSHESSEVKESKEPVAWKSKVVTIFLGILTFITAIQTVQSFIILGSINGGAVKAAAETKSTAPLPSSLNNLPNMVGGC